MNVESSKHLYSSHKDYTSPADKSIRSVYTIFSIHNERYGIEIDISVSLSDYHNKNNHERQVIMRVK